MTTSEHLAECEAMLQKLEAVNAAATGGEWKPDHDMLTGEPRILARLHLVARCQPDLRFSLSDRDDKAAKARAEANARAVCLWKRLAEQQVTRWRERMSYSKLVIGGGLFSGGPLGESGEYHAANYLEHLHAELREATDGL